MDPKAAPKQGRPREYAFSSLDGFAHPSVGLAAAALDELRERVIDQVCDLPQEAVTFAPSATNLTIGGLVAHLIWAELGWVARVSGCPAPEELRAPVDAAGEAVLTGEGVIPDLSPGELLAHCRHVRDAHTVPVLAVLRDIDRQLPGEDRPMTARAILMHLIWHWTYHSAHIGLIRELWGSGYTWTFGRMA